jgi:benzylsuccinate CoA-transferase BbsE subunit
MKDKDAKEGILAGYRVIDLTDEKGLLCGKVLADYGADVIKVEPPGGSRARDIGPFYKKTPHRNKSLFWFFTNSGKRSITLNLETVDGREIFRQLVQTAHFLIESFNPGYLAGLGLAYDDLKQLNPGLVMTSITPFGQKGPYAHYEATDITVAAMAGHMRLYGEPDRAPLRVGQPQAFFHGGVQGAMGSMVAHYHRELTGEGQHVDVSCQQALILTLMHIAEIWDINRINYRGGGAFSIYNRPAPLGRLYHRRIWACKDGHICLLIGGGAAVGLRRSTEFVIKGANEEGYALELKDLDWANVSFAMLPQDEWAVIEKALSAFLVTKTKSELFSMAVSKSLMICPVNMAQDVLDDPHLKGREYWVDVAHDELGASIPYPGAPVRIANIPWRIQRRAPLVGEHNEEMYTKELGISQDRLAALKARGVI